MRYDTIQKITESAGKEVWAYLPAYGEGFEAIHRIVIRNGDNVILPFYDKENEFFYEFYGSFGIRKGSLGVDMLFDTQQEAKSFAQTRMSLVEVEENPAGYTVGIYKGSMTMGLTKLDNEQFEWDDHGSYQGVENRSIALGSIYQQAVEKGLIHEREMLTVFYMQPLKGYIYECGNYGTGQWVCEGKTKGYA